MSVTINHIPTDIAFSEKYFATVEELTRHIETLQLLQVRIYDGTGRGSQKVAIKLYHELEALGYPAAFVCRHSYSDDNARITYFEGVDVVLAGIYLPVEGYYRNPIAGTLIEVNWAWDKCYRFTLRRSEVLSGRLVEIHILRGELEKEPVLSKNKIALEIAFLKDLHSRVVKKRIEKETYVLEKKAELKKLHDKYKNRGCKIYLKGEFDDLLHFRLDIDKPGVELSATIQDNGYLSTEIRVRTYGLKEEISQLEFFDSLNLQPKQVELVGVPARLVTLPDPDLAPLGGTAKQLEDLVNTGVWTNPNSKCSYSLYYAGRVHATLTPEARRDTTEHLEEILETYINGNKQDFYNEVMLLTTSQASRLQALMITDRGFTAEDAKTVIHRALSMGH